MRRFGVSRRNRVFAALGGGVLINLFNILSHFLSSCPSEIPRRTTSAREERVPSSRQCDSARARAAATAPLEGRPERVVGRGMSSDAAAMSSDAPLFLTHAIAKTDSLATIAVKYGVTIRDVKRANGGMITDATLHARASVRIPRTALAEGAPLPGGGGSPARRGPNRQRRARGDAGVLRDKDERGSVFRGRFLEDVAIGLRRGGRARRDSRVRGRHADGHEADARGSERRGSERSAAANAKRRRDERRGERRRRLRDDVSKPGPRVDVPADDEDRGGNRRAGQKTSARVVARVVVVFFPGGICRRAERLRRGEDGVRIIGKIPERRLESRRRARGRERETRAADRFFVGERTKTARDAARRVCGTKGQGRLTIARTRERTAVL